jgi:hypothetical protein
MKAAEFQGVQRLSPWVGRTSQKPAECREMTVLTHSISQSVDF